MEAEPLDIHYQAEPGNEKKREKNILKTLVEEGRKLVHKNGDLRSVRSHFCLFFASHPLLKILNRKNCFKV